MKLFIAPLKGRSTTKQSTAFTLVELLISMVVLVMLLGLLASLFGNISNTWVHSRGKLDNFSRARALINSISRDIKSAVIKQDLAAFPDAESISFYVQQFGENSPSKRPLTYISYAQIKKNGRFYIQRSDSPIDYLSTSTLDWQPFSSGSASIPTPSIERLLCNGVIAFTYQFIQSDGTASRTFNNASSAFPTKAIRISLAVLNEEAERLLGTLGGEDQLASALKTAIPPDGKSAKAAWDALIARGSLSYPPAILAGIRSYERVAPLESSPLYIAQ